MRINNSFSVAIFLMTLSLSSAIYYDEFYKLNKAFTQEYAEDKISNCKVQTSDWMCVVCNDEYYLKDNTCIKNMDNCYLQSETGYCEQCKSEYYLKYESNSRKITSCLNTISNCIVYNSYEDCFQCNDGYYLQGNSCKKATDDRRLSCYEFDSTDKCIRPHKYFALDVDLNLVDNRRTNCKIFDKDSKCTACHVGYTLDSESCIKILNDSDLPHNWLYVSLSTIVKDGDYIQSTKNTCNFMYNKIPSYFEIVDSGYVTFGGCFKDASKDDFKDDLCNGTYKYINNQVVCDCIPNYKNSMRFVITGVTPRCKDLTKFKYVGGLCNYYYDEIKCFSCDDSAYLYQEGERIYCQSKVEVPQCSNTEFYDQTSNSCISKIDKCKQYKSDSSCAVCDGGYYTQGDKCTLIQSHSCCNDNQYQNPYMYIQEENYEICLKCNKGQYLDINNKCAIADDKDKCNNEKYQVWFNGLCQNIKDCAQVVLDVNNEIKCQRCDIGFKLKGNICTNKKEDGHVENCALYNSGYTECINCLDTYFFNSKKECIKKITNCKAYNSDGTCQICEDFYTLKVDKTGCDVVANIDDKKRLLVNCKEWDTNYKCTKCSSLQYQVKEGQCQSIDYNLKCQAYFNNFQDNPCIQCIKLEDGQLYAKNCIVQTSCTDYCFAEECENQLYGKKDASCINSVGLVPYCSTYVQDEKTKLYNCTACYPNYLLTADSQKCLKSIDNCKTLTRNSNIYTQTCNACTQGFNLTSDQKGCIQTPIEVDASSSLILQLNLTVLALLSIIISFI